MIGIIIITLTALIFSIIIVQLESVLRDNVDEVTKLLPGYNCRACGYSGCGELATAISKDSNLYKKCKFLKDESLEKMEQYINKQFNHENRT